MNEPMSISSTLVTNREPVQSKTNRVKAVSLYFLTSGPPSKHPRRITVNSISDDSYKTLSKIRVPR